MNTIYLQIAGFNLKICFHTTEEKILAKKLQKDILKYYKNFITIKLIATEKIHSIIHFVSKSFHSIQIKKKNKSFRVIGIYQAKSKKVYFTNYYISITQFQLLLTDIIQKLLIPYHGFLLHASAIDTKGGAIIFTGRQGLGKSTVVHLLKGNFSVIADDSIIIKKERRFYCYQTPFIEGNYSIEKTRRRFPIQAICFLKKDKSYCNLQTIVDPNFIIPNILKEMCTGIKSLKKKISILVEFMTVNNFYRLIFSKNKSRLLDIFQVKFNTHMDSS